MRKIVLIKILLIIVFSCLVSENSIGQSRDDIIEKGIMYVYHLKFDSAEMQFNKVKSMEPRNPAGYFFDALVEWWKINLDKTDESRDEEFYERIEKVVDVADEILDENEYDVNALLYKGGALGYRGLVRSLRDSWLKAAEDGKEALNLLKKASDLNPANKDALLGIGIYNFFAEYVPERYPIVKPLMIIFPKGDKVKGLFQIKEAASNSKFGKYEARFILAFLYLKYEKNFYECESYSRNLFQEFPENPVFEKYLYNSYVGLGKWYEAINGWEAVLQKNLNGQPGYNNLSLQREANYYIALSFSKLGRILEAEKYLLKSEEITKIIDKEDTAFGAFTYLLLGMLHDAKGNKDLAYEYYDKVISMKNFQNSRADAENLKK